MLQEVVCLIGPVPPGCTVAVEVLLLNADHIIAHDESKHVFSSYPESTICIHTSSTKIRNLFNGG